MDVVHRRRAQCAPRAIDATDPLFDLTLESPVGIDLAPGGHGNLNIAKLVAMFGLTGQEALDGFEPTEKAFGVVQAIDAEHDPASSRLRTYRCRLGDYSWVAGQVAELRGIDAHGTHAELDLASSNPNAVDVRLDPFHVQERGDEMPQVRVGMEADEIRTEQAVQYLPAPRQHPEYLG